MGHDRSPLTRMLDAEAVLVGLDEFEQVSEVVVFDIGLDQLLALPIHEADIHLAGMQIDSRVELSGGDVLLHRSIQCWVSRGHRLILFVTRGGNTPRPFASYVSTNQQGL